jgi:hypothetical protein
MKYLLISILLFQFLFSNENNLTNEEIIFKRQAQIQSIIDEQFPKKIDETTAVDEDSYANQILLDDNLEFNSDSFTIKPETQKQDLYKKAQINQEFIDIKKSKNIYVNFEKIPKIIFENQRFEIVLKTTIATDEFDRIETRFIDFKNVTILNHQNEWIYGGKNNFYNKYNLKVTSEDFILPTFQILMYKENKIYEIITLKTKNMKLAKVAKDNEKFSNVIAQNLEIVTHKTKQYTNNKLLTIIELRTTQGNVEDFNLKDFDDQGVTSINIEDSQQTAIYYAIIPLHVKKITFDYYNSKTNSFERVESLVSLKNELVSTQTDLNPNKSNILLYKKIAIGTLAFFFLILFLLRRKFLYIFLFLVFLIVFILL